MKIYLFNAVSGAYLGEDFADEGPFRCGEFIIPDDATTIPPPRVEAGRMAFFNVREQCWEVCDIPAQRNSLPYDTLGEQPPSEEIL